MQQRGSLLGGTLLIAGTAIGGGMLALPVLTALGGFIPAIFIYTFCWLFMAATGLLFLEVSLWLHEGANIITMAETTLGNVGRISAWLLYLFLFYSLTIAYLVGGGCLLNDLAGIEIPALGPLIFALLFVPPVIFGTGVISALNGIFVVMMAVLYFTFIVLGIPYIKWELLLERNWSMTLMSLPVAFTAFAYQGIIPTLVTYLQRNSQTIRKAIIFGSALPLITYIIWEGLILGIIPVVGPGGLAEALQNGENAVQPLRHFINQPLLLLVGQVFAFLALLTSFFGVTLGLMDFIADGIHRPKQGWNLMLIASYVFIPPLVVSIAYPDIFLVALDVAGGFGCALLLGLLPIVMVWIGRYHLGYQGERQLPGGKALLAAMAFFVIVEVISQVMLMTGYFR
jgi:tyrosine-specific transport protein